MLELVTAQAQTDTEQKMRSLVDYTKHLQGVRAQAAYDAPESSLCLPDDDDLLIQVRAIIAKKVTQNLKYSIVVGIGGSNLGTKAVYDALYAAQDAYEPARTPRLLFAETTDPEALQSLCKLIMRLESSSEVLVTLISKSGGTTETIANFEIIMQALTAQFEDALDRVVTITDENSALWKASQSKGMSCLAIPAEVGGRYSVFSAVGLVPLASVGIDIAQLREGAQAILDRCLGDDSESLAGRSAAILADRAAHGYTINDNFFFHPELESLGKWYRQLMGESIGKERSITGEVVHAGITPTVSLGSTDLHSVGQLYLGGPKDKCTTFVSVRAAGATAVPDSRVFPGLVPMITGKSAADIMAAIFEGVKIAYRKAELPFMEVVLDALDEHSIGAYLQFKMLEMMYLGNLLQVNSFDQPNVESYKIETKRLLES